MKFTARFSGLCNFVPIFGDSRLDKVVVLLVNGQDPDIVPGGKVVGNDLVIFEHYAFLRFPLESVAPGAPPDAFGLWNLDGCDVSLLDGNGASLGGLGL